MPDRLIQGILIHPITGQPWAAAPLRIRLIRPFPDAPLDVLRNGWTITAGDDGAVQVAVPLPPAGQALYSLTLPDSSATSVAIAMDDGSPLALAELFGGDGATVPPQRRTVFGMIRHPAGNDAWAYAPVVVALQAVFASGTAVYPKESHTVLTGSDGAFAIDLAVPASGQVSYRITLPDGTTWQVDLAAGADAIALQALAIAAGLVPAPGSGTVLPDITPGQFASRMVFGTILLPNDPSRPWARAPVTFTLDRPFATSVAVWPKARHAVYTDAAGAFAVDLAVPGQGSVPYTVELPDATRVSFLLDAGDPVPLQDLMAGVGDGIETQPTILSVIEGRIAQHAGRLATESQVGHIKVGAHLQISPDGALTLDPSVLEGHDAYYRHVQSAPAAVWTIQHNLGKRPAITITDSTGEVVEGDVLYLGTTAVEVRFSAPFSGEAICN